MLRFILRRFASAVVVLFTISVMVYLIFFATPGVDPAARIAGRSASPAVVEQVRIAFGLNRPLPIRYLLMMDHLFIKRDLTSYVNIGDKVVPQILAAAPVTLSLVLGAVVIWLIVGVLGGLVAAANKGKFIDPLIMFLGIAAVSVPAYWLGEVVNLITQNELHSSVFAWLPAPGWVPLTQSPGEWALHLLFPWLTLAALYAGIYARVLRAELVNALNEDYVRTARAKGLAPWRVVGVHAFRNALIPVITTIGLQVGVLLGGAILTETIFSWPGIGKWMVDSIFRRDYPVVQGSLLLIATIVMIVNLIVDVLYSLVNPRIRHIR
jgi:peptide/nickel transport system permease protein